ncbi:MAG: GtrA family protein [Polaromonas sp.]|nr:GtrA family protein [Polaromonas sp.]MDB5938972.1 GtrA family protein [Polaromonas sp.]
MQKSRFPWSSWRALFVLTVLWGALIFWVAPHPPMVDLAQHAGQVALLRDMLLGQSPWSELFRINPFTPYVLGYGLALPLSMVMPVAAALKLLLSLGYVVFVFMCIKLRREFNADPRLDWLFLLGFFGFAYKWGFFTFLIAAPLGLWFILLSVRFARQPSLRRGAGIVAVGLAMLASHGLIFVFAWGVGGLLVLAAALRRGFKPLLTALLPYVLLFVACAVYFLISRHFNAGLEGGLEHGLKWRLGLLRRHVLSFAVGGNGQANSLRTFFPVFVLMAAAPWMMGLRIDWRRVSNWMPFLGVVLILALVPHFAFNTAFLYERFALFLLPAYAWMFSRPTAPAGEPAPASRLGTLGMAMMAGACWAVLGQHTVWSWNFRQETRDFSEILSVVEPRQRALTLVFEPNSQAAKNDIAYIHFPAWYQAEKQGLIDFNFAWFPPQVVRFRPDRLPTVTPGFDWKPEDFKWRKHRGDDYRYFFVRRDGPLPTDFFAGAPCPPVALMTREHWTVFERRACGEPPGKATIASP